MPVCNTLEPQQSSLRFEAIVPLSLSVVIHLANNMSNFSNPFKKQPSAKEAAKGVKKEVRSSQRELDRELRDIDRREAQLIADIKKQARDGRETSM